MNENKNAEGDNISPTGGIRAPKGPEGPEFPKFPNASSNPCKPSAPSGSSNPQPKNKELNMKLESKIALVKNDASVIEVPKDEVTFPIETSLPAICLYNDKKSAGIAIEYREYAETFLINIDKNKVYSSNFFDEGNTPNKVGQKLSLNNEGKLSSKAGDGEFTFVKKMGDAIFFTLK